jgi:hypothetical protein
LIGNRFHGLPEGLPVTAVVTLDRLGRAIEFLEERLAGGHVEPVVVSFVESDEYPRPIHFENNKKQPSCRKNSIL